MAKKKFAILVNLDDDHPAVPRLAEITGIVAAEIACEETKADWSVNGTIVGDTSYHVIAGHSSFANRGEVDPEKPI